MRMQNQKKNLTLVESSSRKDNSVIDQLSSLTKNIIQPYFTKPDEAVSNRAVKLSKKKVENYISKAHDGYIEGDRAKFSYLATKINKVIGNSESRPAGENIFATVKNIMDNIADKNCTDRF